MNLDRLQTFRDVVRCGSIAAAARLIGGDPSVASRHIASLEADLGVRLFQRTTRRLELTEAGAEYFRRIEPVIDELAAARDEVLGLAGRPHGRLRITASSAYGQTVIAPLLRTFRQSCPDIELELMLTDALVDLVAERIDLAIRLGPRPSGDLIVARLMPTTMHLVAAPSYLDAAPSISDPDAIRSHACMLSSAQRQGTWRFRRCTEEVTIAIDGLIATSNTLVLQRCARDGLGLAVLADWLVENDIASGRLTHILPEWEVASRTFDAAVWFVYPSRRFVPLKTRAFIDHVRKNVGHTGGALDG